MGSPQYQKENKEAKKEKGEKRGLSPDKIENVAKLRSHNLHFKYLYLKVYQKQSGDIYSFLSEICFHQSGVKFSMRSSGA